MTSTSGPARPRPSWGHLALLIGLVGYAQWYLYDTWRVSRRAEALALILPASALCLLLGLAIFALEFRPRTTDAEPTAPVARPMALMAALVAFAVLAPRIGFELSTVLYTAVSVIILGERRLLAIVGFSVGFTVVVVGLLGYMTDLPTSRLWPW